MTFTQRHLLGLERALFFGSGHQLPVAQQCRGCIVVIAGDSEDVHSRLLSPGQIDRCRAFWMVQPLFGGAFDAQRVCKQPHRQPERQHQDSVKDRQEEARLKITDLMSKPLPAFPQAFPHWSRRECK